MSVTQFGGGACMCVLVANSSYVHLLFIMDLQINHGNFRDAVIIGLVADACCSYLVTDVHNVLFMNVFALFFSKFDYNFKYGFITFKQRITTIHCVDSKMHRISSIENEDEKQCHGNKMQQHALCKTKWNRKFIPATYRVDVTMLQMQLCS